MLGVAVAFLLNILYYVGLDCQCVLDMSHLGSRNPAIYTSIYPINQPLKDHDVRAETSFGNAIEEPYAIQAFYDSEYWSTSLGSSTSSLEYIDRVTVASKVIPG
jgi:hypothetical protein